MKKCWGGVGGGDFQQLYVAYMQGFAIRVVLGLGDGAGGGEGGGIRGEGGMIWATARMVRKLI